jgi:hypothetical protein
LQGPQGATGPQGVISATGIDYGDYLIWNTSQWTAGLQASVSNGKQLNSIAIGCKAGFNNQGSGAIAIGGSAGITRQNEYAIAMGYDTGGFQQGTKSVAIGYRAGYNSQGAYSIAIGYQSNCAPGASRSVAIGYNAYAANTNQIVLGNVDTTGVYSTAFFCTSDYRFKDYVTPIKETNYSLDHLKPIVYQNKYNKTTNMGFLAHELQEHIPFLVTNKKDDEKGHQTINYDGLIGLCVKEIQDLKRELKEIKAFLKME